MKHGKAMMGTRIGVALGTLASAAALVVLPAQPAAATGCDSTPVAPSMIDHKIFILNGRNQVQCDRRMDVLIGRATIDVYSAKSGSFRTLGAALSEANDVEYIVTEVYADCAGHGPSASLRTAGTSTNVVNGTGRPEDDWHWDYSDLRNHYCGGGQGLQDILT